MNSVISWLFIIVGIFALISGCGYFFALYSNYGEIYFIEEIPAVIQVLLSAVAIIYGFQSIKKKKHEPQKT